jgi:hypothetical protein
MATIYNFPSNEDRNWKVWEEAIRSEAIGKPDMEVVVSDALPRLHKRWEEFFVEQRLEGPNIAIPGDLSGEQVEAIKLLVQANVDVAIDLYKKNRAIYFGHVIALELQISRERIYGNSRL